MDHRSDDDERTETDERVAENATPSPRIGMSKDAADLDPATGLVRGQHDDDSSPLDAGGALDPTRARPPRP